MRLLASQDPRWWMASAAAPGWPARPSGTSASWWPRWRPASCSTEARRLLRSRYLLIGGLIAAALAAPDVIWQAAARLARAWTCSARCRPRPGTTGPVYWPGQILYTGVVLTPVWVAGAVWSLRSAASPALPAGGDRLRER